MRAGSGVLLYEDKPYLISKIMKRKLKHVAALVAILALSGAFSEGCTSPGTFTPGALWPDDRGEHINAHGGGILRHEGVYYWFGENKCDTTSNAQVGVMCYSSRNLTDWKYESVALAVSEDPSSEIVRGCIIERPKVIYNARTGKFVMWFHLELKGQGYQAARAAVAVSDTPAGPYEYLYSVRPNKGFYPENMSPEEIAALATLKAPEAYKSWSEEWRDAVRRGLFMKRDFDGGQMSRDMTLFVDDDGKAYHVFASEGNLTLDIAELSDDYLSHTGRYVRVDPAGHNEAPALFKRNGKYWMITSGCTGWAPNRARLLSADHIFGPWTRHDTPMVGPDSDITFGGQSTYVLKVDGKEDAYIFMADRWRPELPSDGRYIWLPIDFNEQGFPVITWRDSWSLSYFD